MLRKSLLNLEVIKRMLEGAHWFLGKKYQFDYVISSVSLQFSVHFFQITEVFHH